jgi:hypothetical protein
MVAAEPRIVKPDIHGFPTKLLNKVD